MDNPLTQSLTPELVRFRLAASDKWGAIAELLDLLEARGKLRSRAEVEKCVRDRERLLPTGLEHGLAVPHAKSAGVDELVVALGLSEAGINFACTDGQPAKIILLAISPSGRSGPHIQLLAAISRALHHPGAAEALLAAPNPEHILALLKNGSH